MKRLRLVAEVDAEDVVADAVLGQQEANDEEGQQDVVKWYVTLTGARHDTTYSINIPVRFEEVTSG